MGLFDFIEDVVRLPVDVVRDVVRTTKDVVTGDESDDERSKAIERLRKIVRDIGE